MIKIVVAVLFLCVAFSLADDRNDRYKRGLQVEINSKSVKVESAMRTGTSKDQLKFEMESDDEFHVRMQYATSASRSMALMRFKGYAIIEYQGTGAFVNGSTPIVSTYRLRNWKSISCPNQKIGNATVYTCSATTTDNVFAAQVMFSTDLVATTNVTMRPTSTKISFVISNFPYRGTGTRLALVGKVYAGNAMIKREENESEEKREGLVKSKEKQVKMGNMAFFSWLENAVCDNIACSVANTAMEKTGEEDGEDRIIFSFLATSPRIIDWDPKLGVSADLINGATSKTASCLLLVLVAALLTLFM